MGSSMIRRPRWHSLGAIALLGASSAFAATDLSITKSSRGGVRPGDDLVYTIVVTNGGPDAVTDAMVADPTPAGLAFVSNAGDCTTPFPCSLGAISAGQTRTIAATFTVPAGYSGPDPIVNTAVVSSSTTDTNPANDAATAETAITRVAGFFALPPCRVVDTRGATGVPLGGPPLDAGAARRFPVRKQCGLPDNADAVSYNLTVTAPTGAGDLRIYPGGTSAPLASAINYLAGQTRANNGIVPLGADGSIAVQCDQASGIVEMILDVNGYFASTDSVPTASGSRVSVRPAPEVEINFDNVVASGGTAAQVIEFADNRAGAVDQDLRAFFPPGSPFRALLPSVIVPSFVTPLGKGGPSGPPTFLLSVIDSTATFARTAEFHGREDFRLGWDPPCRVPGDPTQEPRTFYARDPRLGEPSLVEEVAFGGPAFVDISSGCGSNKGSGWNFSLYLTARDTRTPLQIATYMLQGMQDALGALAPFIIDGTVASQLGAQVGAAIAALGSNPAAALSGVNNVIEIVDSNPGAFQNSTRNVAGELVGRALSARYMIQKLVPLGAIVEFPIPTAASLTTEVTTGPDGNLWFGEGIGRIGRITPAGTISEFFMQTSDGIPGTITGGPDGNVWFALWVRNRIGRITPSGVVTEFPLPTPNSYPRSITAGPDGNLWFVERDGNKVGRSTPSGVITEFPIPTAGSMPQGITAGPDGNLWFAENAGNKIGRITTTGVITEFTVPTANSGPGDITLGPDGNLWFTEWSVSRIGRITPGGVFTELPLPPGARCQSITAGADGNLWVTDPLGNELWRITPAGALTGFPVPTSGADLWGITAGPDGNVWFVERVGNKIGRIVP